MVAAEFRALLSRAKPTAQGLRWCLELAYLQPFGVIFPNFGSWPESNPPVWGVDFLEIGRRMVNPDVDAPPVHLQPGPPIGQATPLYAAIDVLAKRCQKPTAFHFRLAIDIGRHLEPYLPAAEDACREKASAFDDAEALRAWLSEVEAGHLRVYLPGFARPYAAGSELLGAVRELVGRPPLDCWILKLPKAISEDDGGRSTVREIATCLWRAVSRSMPRVERLFAARVCADYAKLDASGYGKKAAHG
jgi:hypothetical protein